MGHVGVVGERPVPGRNIARSYVAGGEDGVWPSEFHDFNRYTRAGTGSLDASRFPEIDQAEFRRTDFEDLRDFALDSPGTLSFLARAYMYWIALTDCDGFRIDTVKHVSYEQARNFCGAIKEFAVNLGKRDFFLVGEVPDDDFANRYLNAVGRNLNATLDIWSTRRRSASSTRTDSNLVARMCWWTRNSIHRARRSP
ncbi:MAG TPA: alpha-amylase family glycosyl hydrolase [Propionibacteriaceae bacterium]|nr:alpha-amylase family glycosyl hydrolase [Propionibacteriaceae bacterium]